jgi:hypothetical protein
MESNFKNQVCGKCGSTNLAHFTDWYSGTIPAGIEGFIGCRDCQYWEQLLSIADAESELDAVHWTVLAAGQGSYRGSEEREKTITYRNPDAEQYPRFGV